MWHDDAGLGAAKDPPARRQLHAFHQPGVIDTVAKTVLQGI